MKNKEPAVRTKIIYKDDDDRYKVKMTIPSSCPIYGHLQFYSKEAQPKTDGSYHKADNLNFILDNRDLSIDPYDRTYFVAAYGTFIKDDGDPGSVYEFTGKYKILDEKSYRDTVASKMEAGGLRGNTSVRAKYYAELWEGNVGEGNNGGRNVGIENFGIGNQGVHCCGVYNKGFDVMGIFNTSATRFYMFNKPVPHGVGTWRDALELFPAFLQKQFVYGEPKYSEESAKKYKQLTPLEAFERARLQEDWPEQHKQLLALPNFDYGIFETITGISKKMLAEADKIWKAKFKKKGK